MFPPIHPVHAVLLAGTVPLFLGVLLSDLAYSSTYEIQWKNFASWLIVASLVYCGIPLLWSIIGIGRAALRTSPRIIYAALLLLLWVLGFFNALVHAGDAWTSRSAGSILSAITAVLAMVTTGFGFAGYHRRVPA